MVQQIVGWRGSVVSGSVFLEIVGRNHILQLAIQPVEHVLCDFLGIVCFVGLDFLVKNPPPAPGRLFLGVAISSASGRDLSHRL